MIFLVTGGSGSGKSAYAEALAMRLQPGKKAYVATMRAWGAEGRARVERHRKLRAGKNFLTVEQPLNLLRLAQADWLNGADIAQDAIFPCARAENASPGASHAAHRGRPSAIPARAENDSRCAHSGEEVCRGSADCTEPFAPVPENACSSTQNRPTVLVECVSNLLANEMYDPEGAGARAEEAILAGFRQMAARAEHLIIVSNEIFSDGAEYDADTLRYIQSLGRINRALAEMADEVVEVAYGIAVYLKRRGL